VLLHKPPERGLRDPSRIERAALDAGAVHGGRVAGRAVKLRADLVDRLGELLWPHFARQPLVRPHLGVHRRDPVLLVARVPGLDRAPGELEALVVLVGEHDAADVLDAFGDRTAGGELDRAQHTDLEIRSHAFHGVLLGWWWGTERRYRRHRRARY